MARTRPTSGCTSPACARSASHTGCGSYFGVYAMRTPSPCSESSPHTRREPSGVTSWRCHTALSPPRPSPSIAPPPPAPTRGAVARCVRACAVYASSRRASPPARTRAPSGCSPAPRRTAGCISLERPQLGERRLQREHHLVPQVQVRPGQHPPADWRGGRRGTPLCSTERLNSQRARIPLAKERAPNETSTS